jgi:hypothetical protein
MAAHEIVDMTIVRHSFVPAGRPVDMSRLVPVAGVVRSAR